MTPEAPLGPTPPPVSGESSPNHSSAPEFVAYYAEQSQSEYARAKFESIVTLLGRVLGDRPAPLDVGDIGCGAGAQCQMWARRGHRVFGLDVNESLMRIAQERATAAGDAIEFRLGSATAIPLPDGSLDVCIAADLLEHVPQWERCLDEFARVLRPKGVLFIGTSSALCPVQQEFTLPLYSWYPAPLKRHFEHLARTTRPELANHATYPAVNWFTIYQLRRELDRRGLDGRDRFDLADTSSMSSLAARAIGLIRSIPPLRWVGHVLTPYTIIVGIKR